MRRTIVILALLLLVLLSAAVLRLMVGQGWGWPQGDKAAAVIRVRLTRVQLAVLVGASLASSGVALQALLRNHLASPFVLGLSSGAALGVMGQQLIGVYLSRPVGEGYIGALMGALGSMAIVYGASRRQKTIDPLGLLLIGVVMDTINGALIMLVNYGWGSTGLKEDIARWMMGYLNESILGAALGAVAVATCVGIAVLLVLGRAMDVATFSEAEAQSLGVNLPRLRALLFVTAGALAAGAVVLAGPVAFVGLICPHVARLLLGPSHRVLVLGSAMAGAALMLLADSASTGLDWGQGQLPVGIFTAIIGGPVFVWMLRPQLGRSLE